MRWSKAYIPTVKEDPADAEVVSHKLMVRAGMMKKVGAGIYTLLPLGLVVTRKVEQIVREEMNRIGALEVFMPVLSPAELWKETGRWDVYGEELMRLKDRHKRDFVLGPTHEEVVTDLVRGPVRSYRQLPLTLYQIQTKFRDEIRPRFGVMRGREFIMKDAYSFNRDDACLDRTYKDMHGAYEAVFRRCGLAFRPVLADSGAIGGDVTHEFMVLAQTGESRVISCPNDECAYAATDETAESIIENTAATQEPRPLAKTHTPDMKTVEEVCSFLKVEPRNLVKTILYQADGEVIGALTRGDREISEPKLRRALRADVLSMADPDTVRTLTGAEVGFAGPVGLKGVKLVADKTVTSMVNCITGANKTDYHLTNVNYKRDFSGDLVGDITVVAAGDKCIRCGATLTEYRGIEVGQIFKLGRKYSVAMKATFIDEQGNETPFTMGCYGIGITRTVAAAIEQNHDGNGIIWPPSLAPYQVLVTPVAVSDEATMSVAESVYSGLCAKGVEVLLDDRDERPGVKFKDADLIGIPLRVTIGSRGLKQGTVEARIRRTGATHDVPVENAVEEIMRLLSEVY
ncbi:MAG: proline--tRNA ligase [Candidatus Abyssobacteria bacterium SURF_17]|uniref:Proline--tRNA ligase n=1 Tax=Candidatus Abyssobacteria bacterium SURF_17 TaxID=2093361 RepID=A0A419F9K9_9BACT|nr:MAG: proline--tRNA ligase [Candidatus Abyssubacteria bacterium SURF_17]